MEVNETSTPSCLPNYYVFESSAPYYPIPNEKGEAICLLNDDTITASWNIIKSCEPSCSIRECENEQICGFKDGVLRCICAGYIGKYCETIDIAGIFFFHIYLQNKLIVLLKGCDTLNCANNGLCINETETEAAYCNCSGIGYQGSFCENDINECLTNNGRCNLNALCTNLPGSFSCECIPGYQGNGFNCTGIFFFFSPSLFKKNEN